MNVFVCTCVGVCVYWCVLVCMCVCLCTCCSGMLEFNWNRMPCWFRTQAECINIIESKPSRIEFNRVGAIDTYSTHTHTHTPAKHPHKHLKKSIIGNNRSSSGIIIIYNLSSIDSCILRWLSKYFDCAHFKLIKKKKKNPEKEVRRSADKKTPNKNENKYKTKRNETKRNATQPVTGS